MLTIFTPTYNRAVLLDRLFQSLISQTDKNFEWIIVDDGSTDNTASVVADFIEKASFDIVYYKQENKGKHIAINKGVSLATKPFFFIVDSDDYLYENTVAIIASHTEALNRDKTLAGICALKTTFDERTIGGEVNYNKYIGSLIDFRYKKKIKGDKAEVFKTTILKEFPFPSTPNEKFCPEALIWNRIASKYNFLFLPEKIYKCEYLDDGLTSNIIEIRANSPINTLMTYAELTNLKIPIVQKVKATINFWRFSFYTKKIYFKTKVAMSSKSLFFIAFPLGFFLYKRDKNKL